MAFILSSILVKTNLAKRLALGARGRGSGTSAIPIARSRSWSCSCPGAAHPGDGRADRDDAADHAGRGGDLRGDAREPNNFGRNLFLQNLLGINIFSSGFMTGSTANLIAMAFISHGRREDLLHRLDVREPAGRRSSAWSIAWLDRPEASSSACEPENACPRIEGGMEALEAAARAPWGRSRFDEKKGIAIFGVVVFLWVTDRFHIGGSASRSSP